MDGTINWSKAYRFDSDGGHCWSVFTNLHKTPDNGYVIIGSTYDVGLRNRNLIMKTDSVGNKEWLCFFGSSTYKNPIVSNTIMTKDSCYIVCGAYAYGEEGGGYLPYDAYILKYDINGNQKWSKKHRDSITSGTTANQYYGYYTGVTEDENGNLFTIVSTMSYENGQYLGMRFRIRCLDSNGNRKWDKVIDSVGNQAGGLYANSIVLTTDGNIAVAGWGEIGYMDSIEGWTEDRRIFLLITDTSHIDTLTSSIIQYNPKPIKDFALNCYPNPANNETYVEIPKEITDDLIIVYSTNGQIVHEQPIVPNENKINLCNFKPGMYLLRLKNSGLYGKFVVE